MLSAPDNDRALSSPLAQYIKLFSTYIKLFFSRCRPAGVADVPLSERRYGLRSDAANFIRTGHKPARWLSTILRRQSHRHHDFGISESTSPLPPRPAVLLASASSGGTIASVRALDQAGIETHVIASSLLSPAVWSRHVVRSYPAPPESHGRHFLNRLLEIGSANPGLVILPTSDQTAWLYATHAKELRKYFHLYQPRLDSVRRILDKKLLAEAALRAGLDSLPCWDPENSDELRALAPTLPYPILIKPRTHVERTRNDKGVVVETASDLIARHKSFVARERLQRDRNDSVDHRPILQPFVADGSNRVQSVTGFIDRTGSLFVTRRSVKVFQRSQPIGVGVCHESLPSSPSLSRAVYKLCRELNYFGIFEVEFIRFNGHWAVIDFNPRLYNQIGLDIRRGVPLPLLAFLDATGQKGALKEAVAKASIEDENVVVFNDRFTLNAILLAQALFSRMSRQERTRWRQWILRHSSCAVDVALDKYDWPPGAVHALSETFLGLRALPRFLSAKSESSLVVPPAPSKVRSL
jgi:D-aspartate ligase